MRAAVLTTVLFAASAVEAQAPARDYLVLVASESVDRVALVRFGPDGARVEREKYGGWAKMEVAGPHGVAITPDATAYFVTIAHGTPFHQALLEEKGLYYAMWRQQIGERRAAL